MIEDGTLTLKSVKLNDVLALMGMTGQEKNVARRVKQPLATVNVLWR